MPSDQTGLIHSASDGGVAGTHPAAEPFRFLVAPSTAAQFNTARLRLIVVACWRVDDIRFDFDSSFVRPETAAELLELSLLVKDHPGSPLSVFGHADPIGADDYNKDLSGRRATAVYAILIGATDPTRAVALWNEIAAHERWGADQRQAMQTATGLPGATASNDLIKAYIQKLLPPDLKLTARDFLAKGADPKGKGDFQGCSSFNPLLLFSQEDETRFKQAAQEGDPDTKKQILDERNNKNAPNRRVMVLLFRKGSEVLTAKWPCPRASEGTAGCIKRFFSDGERRRGTHLPSGPRSFDVSKDTFACRFYQRISDGSPCDSLVVRAFGFWDAPDVEPIPAEPAELPSGFDPGPPVSNAADGDPDSHLGDAAFAGPDLVEDFTHG